MSNQPTQQAAAIKSGPARHYLLFYKPYDVLCSFADPAGRPTLADFVPVPGVDAAGRLDRDSEGLMLLTDDGQLAHRLTHPRFKLPKIYFVQVEHIPTAEAVKTLGRGLVVQGAWMAADEVELLPAEPDLPPRSVPIRCQPTIPTAWLRIVLREGKKRQIRHMTAAAGHPTLRLVRVAIGPLTLRGLKPGEWRDLTDAELGALKGALDRGRIDAARNPKPDGRGGTHGAPTDRKLPVPHR